MKRCTKCGIKKDLHLFSIIKSKSKINSQCKDCMNKYHTEWTRKYRILHPDSNKIIQRRWREKHIEKHRKDSRDWARNNRDKINKRLRERYHSDPVFKISCLLRTRLRGFIRKDKKVTRSCPRDFLGCTLEELKIHLEKQFQPGMTWNNHGVWHIDHIVPLASFDLIHIDQRLEAFHYLNLRPLWWQDNLARRFPKSRISTGI